MRMRLMVLLLAVTGLLASAGCGGGDATATAGGQTASVAFTGKTVDGAAFDSATLAGKPAVLWFWAPWCTTCRGQAPDVRSLADRSAGKVNVVGVAGLGENAAMRKFVASTGVGSIKHLSDEAGAVWKKYEVTQQSTYVLIDAAGKIVFRGYLDGDNLSKRVAALAG